MSSALLFGGVEGGGSTTTVVILSAPPGGGRASVVGRAVGSGSNGWSIGVPAAAAVMHALLREARTAAGLPADAPLQSLGVCGSGFLQVRARARCAWRRIFSQQRSAGLLQHSRARARLPCSQPSQQSALEACFRAAEPTLARHYYIDNDSPGSIFTGAGGAGGLVLIAGTGSMGQVMAPLASPGAPARTANCGGWGHGFGDEGSAYAIAVRAVRGVFHGDDGLAPAGCAPPASAAAKAAMLAHFGIADKDGMLDVFYKDFDKARVAGFARAVAAAATAGDAFCASVLAAAGAELGDMARTLARHLGGAAGASAVPRIVCVGSVWKSWPLLREAFVAAATAPAAGGAPPPLPAFQLVRLTETSAVGAAWRAAALADAADGKSAASCDLDFGAFSEVLYTHARAA